MTKVLLFTALISLPLAVHSQESEAIQTVMPPSLGAPDISTSEIDLIDSELTGTARPSVGLDMTSPSQIEASGAAIEPARANEAITDVPAETEPLAQAIAASETPRDMMLQTLNRSLEFLKEGGPSIWAISALSVVTVALILWKIWRLALIGAWSKGRAGKAVRFFEGDDFTNAHLVVAGRRGIRSKVVLAALDATAQLPEDRAREETARVAKKELASASSGLRALELIATIAPLLGLLGTVLGMITAFQALQQAGSRADPAILAGGIWEALLTTAAGMAVAIPASAALVWFESVIERIRLDVEDHATRIFVRSKSTELKIAAE